MAAERVPESLINSLGEGVYHNFSTANPNVTNFMIFLKETCHQSSKVFANSAIPYNIIAHGPRPKKRQIMASDEILDLNIIREVSLLKLSENR